MDDLDAGSPLPSGYGAAEGDSGAQVGPPGEESRPKEEDQATAQGSQPSPMDTARDKRKTLLDDLPLSIRQTMAQARAEPRSEVQGEGPALKKRQVVVDVVPLSIRRNMAQKAKAEHSHEESPPTKRRHTIVDDLPLAIRQHMARDVNLVGNARDMGKVDGRPCPTPRRNMLGQQWGGNGASGNNVGPPYQSTVKCLPTCPMHQRPLEHVFGFHLQIKWNSKG